MGSAARISNYAAAGIAQLISMYAKPRGNLVALLPVILGITPATGPTTGGTLFRISGYNFENVSAVTIGGAPATGLIIGGGIITGYSPAGSIGAQNIVVVGPAGSTTLAGAFTYTLLATVTAISPPAGPIAGGTAVSITVSSSVGCTGATVGGSPLTAFAIADGTHVTGTTTAHAVGASDVVVTNASGPSAPLLGAFTYTSGGTVPVVSAVVPNLGDTAGGGGFVVITVDSSTGCTGASLGGVAMTSFSIVDATHVKGIPGAHAAGAVAAVVTNATGSSTTGGTPFEYWLPTQVTGVDFVLDANKGVTQAATLVSAWVDLVSAISFTQATGANKPAQTASVFGSLPSIRFTPEQWVGCTNRPYATNISIFAVAKWTATKATLNGGFGAVPLSIVGDTANGNTAFGASAGAINYTNTGTAAQISRGSGFNTGTPQLIGVTQSTAGPATKHYLGTTLGATQQGATETTTAFSAGTQINVVGESSQLVDGWNGDLGAVIVVNGIISAGDLTKLNTWAQQRFGTP